MHTCRFVLLLSTATHRSQVQDSLIEMLKKKGNSESDDEEMSEELIEQQDKEREARRAQNAKDEQDEEKAIAAKLAATESRAAKRKRDKKKKVKKEPVVQQAPSLNNPVAASHKQPAVEKNTAVKYTAPDNLLQQVQNTISFMDTTWDAMDIMDREQACLQALKRFRSMPSSHSSPAPPDLESLIASANAFLTTQVPTHARS